MLDKPLGLASTPAVGRVRRLFGAQKAGHGGTLDPLATGVLPIALGEATKTVPWVMDGRKEYRFTLRFGEARSTEDAEGEVIADERRCGHRMRRSWRPCGTFLGEIEQLPPAYSALKIDGKRAYDLARAGETVELAPRKVMIERLELVARPDADHADFVVGCGKGTYIRVTRARPGVVSGHGWTRRGAAPHAGRSASPKTRPFRFPNWRPSGIFPRSSGSWPPLRPRWTTSRRWP